MRDFEGLLFGTDGINCHNARLRSVQVERWSAEARAPQATSSFQTNRSTASSPRASTVRFNTIRPLFTARLRMRNEPWVWCTS